MNQHLINRTVGLVAMAAAILAQSSALATIIDLRNAQEAQASLVARWDFEGGNLAAALLDKSGNDRHLVHRNSTGPAPLTLNSASVADIGTSQRLQITAGSPGGYAESPTPPTPTSFTIEMLLQPQFASGAGSSGMVVSGLTGQRNYFEQSGSVFRWTRVENAHRINVIGGTTGVPLAVDNVYYVALTSSYDSVVQQYILNAFVQNLSDPDALLVRTINDYTFAHATAPSARSIQIGRNNANGTTTWTGLVDEMAIYSSALSSETIALNAAAAAIPIPEPASALLLAIAGPAVLRRQRRR